VKRYKKRAPKLLKMVNGGVATPEAVFAAASDAPLVFSIGAYYQSVRLMREKGNSWRDLSEWLKQFNIEVSFAHLRRLFVEEHRRLVKLEEEQLRNLGMHPDSIRERVENKDPADRLGADDLAEEEEQTS
jgi:hypothetical protein